MKKGIHYWALPQKLNLREKMRFAKKMGFDGLELVILETGELRLDSNEDELEAIRRAAQEEDIEIIALSNSLNWKCSLTSDNDVVRDKAKNMIIRQLQIASSLKVEVILALPGFVGMDFITNDLHPAVSTHDGINYHPGHEVIHYELAYQRSLAAFREIAPLAEQMNITIGIENIWNQFMLSPIEMRNFIDQIGSEYVQVYFDVGNVLPYGHPEQWIRILGSRIKRVHVKDFIHGCPSLKGFVNLLCGDIDFTNVMNALREIDYNSWITAEVNEKPGFPEFTAQSTSLALDQMMKLGSGRESNDYVCD